MQKIFFPCLLTLSLSLLVPVRTVHAADASFTLNNTAPNDTQFSLGSGQTGTVTSTGSDTWVSTDDSIIAVDNTSGNSGLITISNAGLLNNTVSNPANQNGRVVHVTGSKVNLSITNSGTMESVASDVIQAKIKSGAQTATITVNNTGVINAKNTSAASGAGQQGIDFNNLTGGTTTINNYSGGVIEAFDGDAVQESVGGIVYNDGLIQSTRNDSSGTDGIDAGTSTGVTINNAYGLTVNNIPETPSTPATATTAAVTGVATIAGARHGITGGNTTTGVFTMTINNGSAGVIKGNDGSGVNIDGINGSELVTITNHGTITGNGKTGDGDGVDVDGLVNLDNFGTIQSLDAFQDASEGVTVGGGTIKNEVGAKIIGYDTSNTTGEVGVGITLAGIDKDANDNAIPIQTIYADTTVDNFGTIQGKTGAGIQATSLVDQHNITITNEAGATIEGGGTTSAAIQMDGVAGQIGATVVNKVINSGTITADSSGKAIELGAGTNEVDIVGGNAHVNGGISGGIGSTGSLMSVQAGAGNSFTYSGAITNFANVKVASGNFNFGGTITGATTIIQSGGTLSGNNTVGALVIAAGGTLSPGNSPGKISAGNTILNPTGNFLLQVDNDGSTGSAGTNWDQLAVTGTVDVSGLSSSGKFVFELQSLTGSDVAGALGSFNPDVNHLWANVITTTAGFVGTFSPSDFAVDTSLFNEPLDGTFSVVQDSTNADDLDLRYTAAPEPSTWMMLLGGAGLLVAFGRQRVRRNA